MWGSLRWLRRALASPLRLWRVSLLTRTVVVAGLLSGLAVTVIGGYMSLTIQDSLFESRREQIVVESVRTGTQVQSLFDNSVTQAGTIDVETANSSAQTAIRTTQSSPGAGGFAILRTPGQITDQTMTSTSTAGLDISVVSSQIRQAVVQDPSRVHYQSVALSDGAGAIPALVTGSAIQVPSAGQYELYMVYDLSGVQATLTLVQQTLIVGSILLVVLITGVTWLVVRLAIGPVRIAARTAERLAEGYLEERIEERGEDVIATLARSFNKMADSMQSQIVRLAKLSQLQQHFVSDVSHELRTPLTTIRLAADVLYDKRDEWEPQSRRSIELLVAQIERFELMLTDLLEISRYDAGAVTLDRDQVNLVELLEDCLEQLAPLANQRGSSLVLEVLGGYGDVEADSRRVRRVLLNFVGNAIDHGEGKPIVAFVDSDQDTVSVAVRDWGVGMTTEEAARVFDRFWRADPSRQRTTGGTGLGLAIAQEDAIAHGGFIDVWSVAGEGSCFRLTLPRRAGKVVTHSPLPLPPESDHPDIGTTVHSGPAPDAKPSDRREGGTVSVNPEVTSAAEVTP
ncbi:sensor histidine kinase MtrB [Pontimonas salivibrio]|uniref:Sensor histidine kinase MtrB n=2 Tax=Pontimonas salivibrio TaxID=1159327 RepID=A0A2L2BSA5_9MICO|nr:sensor histidine kinase MtrB [Pontimonas salivibrio]